MGVDPATYADGNVRNTGSYAVYGVQSSIEQIEFVGIFTAMQ